MKEQRLARCHFANGIVRPTLPFLGIFYLWFQTNETELTSAEFTCHMLALIGMLDQPSTLDACAVNRDIINIAYRLRPTGL